MNEDNKELINTSMEDTVLVICLGFTVLGEVNKQIHTGQHKHTHAER